MDTSASEYLKGVIEAILFISEKPVALEQLAEVMTESVGGAVDCRKLVEELKEEYDAKQRGMVIVEIAGGYQMLSSQHYASYVRNFLKTKVKEKLSRPSLETLAIVAYKQPVSRGDIEMVRGVNSDGVVLHLLNKGLIKIVGKKDVPGRPFLYGTSKLFLEYFGLKSLRDLPKLEDVSLLLARTEEQAALAAAEEGGQAEKVNSDATRALDEAEAKAVRESEEAEVLAQDAAGAGAEHIETARKNVEEILKEESGDEGPIRLKEVMDEMSRDEKKIEAQASRLEAIIAEETAALEKAENPAAAEDLPKASE